MRAEPTSLPKTELSAAKKIPQVKMQKITAYTPRCEVCMPLICLYQVFSKYPPSNEDEVILLPDTVKSKVSPPNVI